MIIYYTGTGNSRYVAQMLADLTGDECISANDFIKKSEKGRFDSEKPYVFVSPVYVSAPARVFTEFVKNAECNGNKKAYFVMTCAGGQGGCPEYCRQLCEEKGFDYLGTNQIVMPQNYLVFFKTACKEENEKTIAAAGPMVEKLAIYINGEKAFPEPGTKKWEYVSTEMILNMYYRRFMGDKKFTVGDSCIGCGKCVNLCPLNNIALSEGKPVWHGNCTHCMACINSCPKQAIEYGKASVGKPRYICPEYKKNK